MLSRQSAYSRHQRLDCNSNPYVAAQCLAIPEISTSCVGLSFVSSDQCIRIIVTVIGDNLDLTHFSTSNIKSSYRLGRSSKKSRPIVVKFPDVTTRNKSWYAKTKLKGTGITQSEFLTKPRHTAFLEAKQYFGISKCWRRDGYIHVITSDGTRHRIEYSSELENLKSSKSPQNTVSTNKTAQIIIDTSPKLLLNKITLYLFTFCMSTAHITCYIFFPTTHTLFLYCIKILIFNLDVRIFAFFLLFIFFIIIMNVYLFLF